MAVILARGKLLINAPFGLANCSLTSGPVSLSLDASNEGVLRPRVSRAKNTAPPTRPFPVRKDFSPRSIPSRQGRHHGADSRHVPTRLCHQLARSPPVSDRSWAIVLKAVLAATHVVCKIELASHVSQLEFTGVLTNLGDDSA